MDIFLIEILNKVKKIGYSAVGMLINTYLCNRIATAKIRIYAESVYLLPDNSGYFDAFIECQTHIQERR